MKALTVCQPYARLIMLPITDLRYKRVENRTWPTNHRGLIYLHAGKSRLWLDLDDAGKVDEEFDIPVAEMAFGAVVGIVKLLDCLHIDRIHAGEYDSKYPWLREHQHAEGPWCWVLDENVTPIGPWPWRGAQGLFEIDSVELDRVANRQMGVREPGT